MSTTDLLARWSNLSWEEIEAELETGPEESVTEFFGPESAAELSALAEPVAFHGQKEAVILLPGMMGSLLSSIRGVTGLVWINPKVILQGNSDFLTLNREGTGDGHPMVEMVATGAEKITYLRMALSLRRECQLYEFPYDWRRPIGFNGKLLGRFIERWADEDDSMQFTLVGHSMGGLVSRSYVAQMPDHARKRVKRVVMLGTPHFGAAGAVADIMKGNRIMALAKALNRGNDVRKVVMNMPSAYELLPAPRDLFPASRPYPVNWDLYDAREWRLQGVRQDYLDAGKRFHELLADHDHPVEMVEIAGCHQDTIVDVHRSFGADEKPRLDVIRQDEGPDSGDATVPLYSAILPGARIYYMEEVHRYLARNKKIIQATLDLIYDREPDLPTQLPEPEKGLLSFAPAGPVSVEEEAADLRERIESGTLSEQDLDKFYFIGA
ncbi:MAG: alpha/beta fold hydrolase [Chloroflexota bacterium]|nr:alpha/beta fold hydrolase [Chloroflexota bacterium]